MMRSWVFLAVLLVFEIANCFAAAVNNSTDALSAQSQDPSTTVSASNASSAEPSKPNNTASTGGGKVNPLDIGVYSRAFYVLVALGGLVIIYLGAKAFWRTRRGRAAVQKSAALGPASFRKPATASGDTAGLMVNEDEEDEESTVFDQSRERLLKSSRKA